MGSRESFCSQKRQRQEEYTFLLSWTNRREARGDREVPQGLLKKNSYKKKLESQQKIKGSSFAKSFEIARTEE